MFLRLWKTTLHGHTRIDQFVACFCVCCYKYVLGKSFPFPGVECCAGVLEGNGVVKTKQNLLNILDVFVRQTIYRYVMTQRIKLIAGIGYPVDPRPP